jgi:hypothetical protein
MSFTFRLIVLGALAGLACGSDLTLMAGVPRPAVGDSPLSAGT